MMSDTVMETRILTKQYNQLKTRDERIEFIRGLRELSDEQVSAVFRAQTNIDLLRFKESLKAFEMDVHHSRLSLALNSELQMRRAVMSHRLSNQEIARHAQDQLNSPENAYLLEQLYKRAAHRLHIEHFDTKQFSQDLIFTFDKRSKRLSLSWPDPRNQTQRIKLELSANETIDYAGQLGLLKNVEKAQEKLVESLKQPQQTILIQETHEPTLGPDELKKVSLAFVSNISAALTCPLSHETFKQPVLLIKPGDRGRGFVYEEPELMALGYQGPIQKENKEWDYSQADYTPDQITKQILLATQGNLETVKTKTSDLLREPILLELPKEVWMFPNGFHFLDAESVEQYAQQGIIKNPQTREEVPVSKLTRNYNLEKIVRELKAEVTAEFNPRLPSKATPSLLTRFKNRFFNNNNQQQSTPPTQSPPKLD